MEEEIRFVEEAIDDYKDGLGWLQKQIPNVGNEFIRFTDVCFQAGQLSEKQKHLIALGIAIHAQDEYCVLYHGTRALDLGASKSELMETVGVCAAFGAGAGLAQGVTLVRDVIEEFEDNHDSVQQ